MPALAAVGVGTVASLLVFLGAVRLYGRVGTPLLNPLLVSICVIVIFLVATHIPLDSYESAVSPLALLLGPATSALAYSVYRQRELLKRHFWPILFACTMGSLASMTSAYLLCKGLGLDEAVSRSFIPKSVTAPIAMTLSDELSGIRSLTVAAVIVTGIMGAVMAPLLVRVFRVRDELARGLSIGASSHAVGTAKALEMGEVEGAMAGLAIAVSGILTTLIVLGGKFTGILG